MKPLNKEVWTRVIQKLEDPIDKLNVIRASPEIENAFQEEKSELLMQVALSVVIETAEKAPWGSEDAVIQAIQNFRFASSGCVKAVDKYMKDFWNREEHQSLVSVHPKNFPKVQILSPKSFKKFSEKDPEPFPLPARDLRVSCSGVWDKNNPMVEDVVELIQKYGIHLQSLKLASVQFEYVEDLCKLLKDSLTACPNLKRFQYSFNYPLMSPNSLPEAAITLPPLQHLKHLNITSKERAWPFPEFITFQPYFRQLTFLKLGFSMWKNEYFEPDLFPSLQYLHITNIDLDQNEHTGIADIVFKIDFPQLKLMQFVMSTTETESSEIGGKVEFVKKMVLYFLKEKLKGGDYEWRDQGSSWSARRDERLWVAVNIYNARQFKKLPKLDIQEILNEEEQWTVVEEKEDTAQEDMEVDEEQDGQNEGDNNTSDTNNGAEAAAGTNTVTGYAAVLTNYIKSVFKK